MTPLITKQGSNIRCGNISVFVLFCLFCSVHVVIDEGDFGLSDLMSIIFCVLSDVWKSCRYSVVDDCVYQNSSVLIFHNMFI